LFFVISHCEKEGKFFASFSSFLFLFLFKKKSKKGRAPWTVQGEKRSPFVFVKWGLHDRAPTGSWAPNGTVSFLHCFQGSHLVVPANVGLVVRSRVGKQMIRLE
jgi:hypothetical protein